MKIWIKIFIFFLLIEDFVTVHNWIFRRGEYYFIFDPKMNIIVDCTKYEEEPLDSYKCSQRDNIFWKSFKCLGKNEEPLYLAIAEDIDFCQTLEKKIDRKRKQSYKNIYYQEDKPLDINAVIKKNEKKLD